MPLDRVGLVESHPFRKGPTVDPLHDAADWPWPMSTSSPLSLERKSQGAQVLLLLGIMMLSSQTHEHRVLCVAGIKAQRGPSVDVS